MPNPPVPNTAPSLAISRYDVLGVAESASPADIRDAYRKIAHKYANAASAAASAEPGEWIDPWPARVMMCANEAFAVLSNSERRLRYDKMLADRRRSEASDGSGGNVGERDETTGDDDNEASASVATASATPAPPPPPPSDALAAILRIVSPDGTVSGLLSTAVAATADMILSPPMAKKVKAEWNAYLERRQRGSRSSSSTSSGNDKPAPRTRQKDDPPRQHRQPWNGPR